ncbi:RloB domain-containing protein [Paenibacillus algorifonticola]|uniref:RloB domain-containing protein n=1 Tax=Paenibacillus algorifonticola TaxID=684063 RepID=UPI003D2C0FA0
MLFLSSRGKQKSGKKKTATIGKQLKYHLGYSNFTFELWIILHKSECNASFSHRREYLKPINKAYDEHFTNLVQYKQEAKFKTENPSLSIWQSIEKILKDCGLLQAP